MPITQPVVRGTLEREIQLRAIEDDSPVSIWSLVLEWMEHKDREIESLTDYVAVVWANGGFTLAYGSSDATIIPVVWPLF